MPDRREEDRKTSQENALSMNFLIRVGALCLLVYWAYLLVKPLLALSLWAIFIAVSAHPLFERVKHAVGGRPGLAATILVLLGIVVFVGPISFLVSGLIGTAAGIDNPVTFAQELIPAPPEFIKSIPIVGETAFRHWSIATTNMSKVIDHYSEELISAGRYVAPKLIELVGAVLVFLLALIAAGYLFIIGPKLINPLRRAIGKIAPGKEEHYLAMVDRTIRNVAVGTIGLSLLQALVGGMILLVFGVVGAGFITFVAFVLGVIQIGVGGIFTPVAIWALFTMDLTRAIPLAIALIAVTWIDTVLRPFVMARGLETPTIIMLFGLTGGVLLHGVIGLFVGPVVLAIFYSLVLSWEQGEMSE